ncbi:MAG: ABC transporter substrate-binding protein [Bacillota bacterium]|nr:ABC transporter substrate-binding protein [Bacillota bacterium]
MKKRFTALALCVMLILSLCARSEKKTEAKTGSALSEDYSTSIYVCGTWGNFEALDAAAQLFNKEFPNIQVVYEQLGNYGSDLNNRFASGENVDIYTTDWLLSNDERYSYYTDNALELDLDFSSVDERYLQTGLVDGKQFAVPIYAHSYGLMVNEDLLAKYNLSVPADFDEFINCCDTLKNGGIYPVLEADRLFTTQFFLSNVLSDVLRSDKAEEQAEAILNGKDSEGYLAESLSMLENVYNSDYIHPDSASLEDNYNSAIMRFFEGDIAFVPFNTSNFSGTKKREAKSENFSAEPFKYSFVPAFSNDGYGHVVQQLGTVYMSIFDGVEEEKLPYVKAFLQFLIDDEGSAELARVKNMPTSNMNTGCKEFPYLDKLEKDDIYYVGMNRENDTMLRLNQLVRAASLCIEPGKSAENLLEESIDSLSRE